jgi:hypothetical protein
MDQVQTLFLPCKRRSRTRKERNRQSKESHGGNIRRAELWREREQQFIKKNSRRAYR